MGITMNGATPVFVEPDEHFGMDVDKIVIYHRQRQRMGLSFRFREVHWMTI